MKHKRVLITSTAALLTAGAAITAFTLPAEAASTPAPSHTSSVTVKVDKANHDATITTKKGTFTLKWEAIGKGKTDLVTLRNANGKLVAARDVSDKRLNNVLTRVGNHPGAFRLLLHRHLQERKAQGSSAKATPSTNS